MKLYDKLIEDTCDVLKDIPCRRYPYDERGAWKDVGNSEFIMQKDACVEIGGMGMPSVNYTLVTTEGLVEEDEVLLYGKDIREISGNTAFARIVILETQDLSEDTDTEKAFNEIRNLEFVRYHVFPEGYMVRVSAQSDQEQVRISKKALANGISFNRVGNLYIKKYKELPAVKKVRILFITEKDLVETLKPNAEKAGTITKTLTHILDGMPTDCGHCSLKPVCDEVDGMKELHLKSRGARG